MSFNKRRKMLRQSLKELALEDNVTIPEKWSTLRPDQLNPQQFIELTIDMYGTVAAKPSPEVGTFDPNKKSSYDYDVIWRKSFLDL